MSPTVTTTSKPRHRHRSELPSANGVKNEDLPQLTEPGHIKVLPAATVIRDRYDTALQVRHSDNGHVTLMRIGGRDSIEITPTLFTQKGPFALVYLPGHFLSDAPWLQARDSEVWRDGAEAALVSEGYVDPSGCAVLKKNPHKPNKRR